MNRIVKGGQEVLRKISINSPPKVHRDQRIYEDLAKEISRQKDAQRYMALSDLLKKYEKKHQS